MSKRRKGYPSETHVKRGVRIVHGDVEPPNQGIDHFAETAPGFRIPALQAGHGGWNPVASINANAFSTIISPASGARLQAPVQVW